ncbi:MAG: hypothetical protein ACPGVZ_01720 [Myxococcota bacterium]
MQRLTPFRSFFPLFVLLAAACSGGSTDCDCGSDVVDLDSAGVEAAVLEMLSTADTIDRHRRMIALGEALNEDNLPGYVTALDEHIDKIDPNEVRLIAHAWADVDPKGALDHILEEWRYPRVSNNAVEEIVYVWAASGDGDAARAYVDPAFDGPIATPRSPTKFMRLAVLKALAVAGDWENLTGLFSTIENAEDREFWVTRVLVEMNRVNGFAPIREWIDSIPWETQSNIKLSVLKRAIDWRSRKDYAASQAWYEEIEQERPRPSLLEAVIKAQGVREPGNAMLWLADRPKSEDRDRLIREVMAGWLSRDEPELRAEGQGWALANSSNDAVRPFIAPILVRSFMGSNQVRQAADYALQYPEEALADRNLPIILVRWSSMDVDAVEAFLAENEIDPQVIEAYRSEVEQRKKQGVYVERRRGQGQTSGSGGEDQ